LKILFLTHRVPYAPNRGDRVRAYHILRHLARRADVEVVSLAHDAQEAGQIARVREMGVRAAAFLVPRLWNRVLAVPRLPGSTPLTHLLLDAPGLRPALAAIARDRPPDVVLAYCTGMARFALEPPLDRFPLVIDFVDVDSEKWRLLAGTASWLMRWIYSREARLLSAFEARAATAARASLVVNEREAASLRALAPAANVRVMQVGIDPGARDTTATPAADTPSVVFCGVMNYAPNVEGVLWFAREVWPRVRQARPDATFTIVGSDPTPAIRALASAERGIDVTGTVPEVRSYLRRAALAVAPLQTARGVQSKVLEAITLGLPVVVTSPVAEGLPGEVAPGYRQADEPGAFARQVTDLLALPPADRRALIAKCDLAALSWEKQLEPLVGILGS
jgi:sugar transferase (PEP-CTERM/EpsH1 system associated)